MRQNHFFTQAILPIVLALAPACKRAEKFPDLGTKMASPIDVAADKSNSYFFVLNADYPRDYNVGSIVTLSADGVVQSALHVPRLGRSLTVAGDDMLVTFSSQGDEGAAQVQLYDAADPKNIKYVASWGMSAGCNPVNAVMRSGYKYFAVACSNGGLMVGELKTPRSESTLTLVRQYTGARRALHLDVERNLLIAFPTDLDRQSLSDTQLVDAVTYSETDGTETASPNEIPDQWELNARDRAKDRRGSYQYIFAVYDIAAGAAANFAFKQTKEVLGELRWTYFNLTNFDGTPDVELTTDNLTTRYYRTNFWEAKPDPDNSSAFYLSHRGTSYSRPDVGTSPHANSIVHVTITGDLTDTSLKTSDVLSFERVYGFKGELEESGKHYPGDFEIQTVNGSPLLLVNHFRDLINFRGQTYFSLAAKVLGDNNWFTERSSTSPETSYYQVALTPSGRAMAVSFFGNVVILLDALPGADIKELKYISE